MKTLLVCDPSLKIDLPGDEPAAAGMDVTIVFYARLSEQFPHLRKLRCLSTILEEAHHLKNEKDVGTTEREQILKAIDAGHAMSLHRTEIAFELARTIKHIYCLTGTPILSRPRELSLCCADPPSPRAELQNFGEKIFAGQQTAFGWNANGASNLLDLSHALHRHLLRRLKGEVLTLPPKRVTVESFTMPPKAKDRYANAWTEYAKDVHAKKEQRRRSADFRRDGPRPKSASSANPRGGLGGRGGSSRGTPQAGGLPILFRAANAVIPRSEDS